MLSHNNIEYWTYNIYTYFLFPNIPINLSYQRNKVLSNFLYHVQASFCYESKDILLSVADFRKVTKELNLCSKMYCRNAIQDEKIEYDLRILDCIIIRVLQSQKTIY